MEVVCVSCSRGEEEVPLTEWRYQQGRFAVCPECLPMLIHHREQAMERWRLNRQKAGDNNNAPG